MKSQLTLVKSLLAAAGVAAVSAVSAAPAWAFNFGNITVGIRREIPMKIALHWT